MFESKKTKMDELFQLGFQEAEKLSQIILKF
jgi:hypothetical protein